MSLAAAEEAGKRSYDIPAGNAADALKQFSEQSGRGVMANGDLVKGIRTNSVKGEHAPVDALELLLADTGLVAIPDTKSGAFSIRKETTLESKNVNRAIAQNSDRPGQNDASDSEGGKPIVLDTFEVFGRKTLNMDIQRTRDDVQPYVVFDRRTIERSNATRVEDFLRNQLTMVSANAPANRDPISTTGGVSSFAIRGLDTLILVDGHRTASYNRGNNAAGQSDINGIPLGAIERIEVLPTAASGIYGGGAVGGVINIIMRRDYAGVEATIAYNNTFSTDSANFRTELSAGYNSTDGRTQILIAGSRTTQNALLVRDRDFATRGREWILKVNPAGIFGASTPPLGATPNIRSSNGANLVLKSQYGGTSLNSPFTTVPYGYPGISSDNALALVANAAHYNLDLANSLQSAGGGKQNLLNIPTTEALTITLRQRINDSLDSFVDFSASNNRSYFDTSPITTITIPTTSAANPFTQNIVVAVPAINTPSSVDSVYRNRRAVVGLIFKLPAGWRGEFDYTFSQTKYQNSQDNYNTTIFSTDVANGAINVLRDYSLSPIDFSPYRINVGSGLTTATTNLDDFVLRAGGNVGRLPGGAPTVSLLVERLKEKYDPVDTLANNVTSTHLPERSQVTSSAYAEVNVPIFSSATGIPGVRSLDLQLAGRFDRFSVHGATSYAASGSLSPSLFAEQGRSSFNPTIGLRWVPSPSIAFRGSYATGFIPAGINQLVPSPTTPLNLFLVSLLNIRDTRRGNEAIGALGPVTQLNGGSADLKPERSVSYSAGVIITPKQIPGLKLSVDWVDVEKRDKITSFFGAGFLNLEPYIPGYVTRGPVPAGDSFPVGPITQINSRLLNISKQEARDIDVSIDYEFPRSALGGLKIGATGTRTLKRESQVTPGSPVIDGLGVSIPHKLNARLFATLTRGAWELSWSMRYYSAYWLNSSHTVVANQGSDHVSPQRYHSLYLSYSYLGQSKLFKGTRASVGIDNLLNTRPPLDLGGVTSRIGTYYSLIGDPSLARYSMKFSKSF